MTKETKTVVIFAGIFAALALVAMYFVHNTMQQVDQITGEIEAMNAEIATLQAKADRHDELQKQLESLRANVVEYVKILPSPEVATEERLMELVQEKCERSQFGLGAYRVAPRRGGAKTKKPKGRRSKGGGFREIDVTLSANGTFEQFLRFLNSLERHESFLRVNSFSCTSADEATVDGEGNETWPLEIALNISTFRYEAK